MNRWRARARYAAAGAVFGVSAAGLASGLYAVGGWRCIGFVVCFAVAGLGWALTIAWAWDTLAGGGGND